MINTALNEITLGHNLTYEQAYKSVVEIMDGTASEIQIAAFLSALATKGEVADEIAGAAAAMRDAAVPVTTDQDCLDIVGTGGDKSYSFNISSTSAVVIAAAGVPVAKHGNRSASSKSGAADVLESLNISLNQDPKQARQLLNEVNICFLYAANYHKAMGTVAGLRKALGIRTIFNILGPIINPAKPKFQVLGVYDESLVKPMAEVLGSLGVGRGMVVYGQDRMDELSISAKSTICEFVEGEISHYELNPRALGFPAYKKADIVGGNAEENARIMRSILNGKEEGAKRDIVLLNAGAGLYTAGRADSIGQGIEIARHTIDSGKADKTLNAYIDAFKVKA